MDKADYIKLQFIVFSLVAAAFTNIYITQPVLPVLQKEFHVDIISVSFSVSAVILGIALSNFFFGFLADIFPIHPIIFVGGISISILGIICFITHNFFIFIGSRFIQGIFIPTLTTCLAAYLARTLPLDKLNVVMGSYVSATVLGGLSSRLLGGLIHPPMHWRYAFLSAAVITLISTLTAVKLLPKNSSKNKGNPKQVISFTQLIKRADLLGIYLCAMGGFGIFSSVFNYLPYRLSSPPFNLSIQLTTILYLAYIVGIFTGPIAGKISNKIGGGNTLIAGSIVLGFALILLTYPHLIFIIMGLIITCAGFFTIHAAAVGCLNSKLSEGYGRANSIYVLFYYIGGWTGITISGYIYKHFGWFAMIFVLLIFLVIPIITGILETRSCHIKRH